MDTHIQLMNRSIRRLLWNAFSLARKHPACIPAFYRLARHQAKAEKLRSRNREEGIPVPAFMILSVTRKCNLSCRGCYSHATREREKMEGRGNELDGAKLLRVAKEGASLGVSFMLIAGGEPLVRAEEVFTLARENPRVVFPVFTNGTLIDESLARRFRAHRNMFPVLSIEGRSALTDLRRGKGVFESALARMRMLRKYGVFFGLSFTVMKNNAEELVSEDFISQLCAEGAGLFFYNEYTPIENGTESLCISNDERHAMLDELSRLRKKHAALFLAFPGDEDKFGGCLSAGRGFVHVAPDGRLEACPFAPFGDSNAADLDLATALKSPILGAIRANHGELAETSGGCALWNKRDWVESLVGEHVGKAF